MQLCDTCQAVLFPWNLKGSQVYQANQFQSQHTEEHTLAAALTSRQMTLHTAILPELVVHG